LYLIIFGSLFGCNCFETIAKEEVIDKTRVVIGASEGIRTLDIHLGKVTLYQTELRSLPKQKNNLIKSPPMASLIIWIETITIPHVGLCHGSFVVIANPGEISWKK
jgi:hypothetical protein